MYAAGFSGAGIQIILIMVVQSFYGFAYMVAPMMITLFMTGIVAGIISWKKIWRKSSMIGITGLVLIMALLALSGFLLPIIGDLLDSRWSGQLALGLLNFIPGMVVGWIYTMGLGIEKDSQEGIIGTLYSADLRRCCPGYTDTRYFSPSLDWCDQYLYIVLLYQPVHGFSLILKLMKN